MFDKNRVICDSCKYKMNCSHIGSINRNCVLENSLITNMLLNGGKIVNEEQEETEERNIQITDVLNTIATHIILCAEELKREGFSIEDFKY